MQRNIYGTVVLIAISQTPLFEQLTTNMPPTSRQPAALVFDRVVLLGEKEKMQATLGVIVANGKMRAENALVSTAMSVDGVIMSQTLNKGGNVLFMGSADDLRDAMFLIFRGKSGQLNIETDTTVAADYVFNGSSYEIMMISKRNPRSEKENEPDELLA